MNRRFSACATRLAGLICRQLHWRPAEFWDATPAEIAAILIGEDGSADDRLSRNELEILLERDRNG